MSDKKDKFRKAYAARYSEESGEVKSVLGEGSGKLAEEIIKQAKESGTPVIKNPEVLKKLDEINLLKNVPEELLSAAADVMEFVDEIDKKARED